MLCYKMYKRHYLLKTVQSLKRLLIIKFNKHKIRRLFAEWNRLASASAQSTAATVCQINC